MSSQLTYKDYDLPEELAASPEPTGKPNQFERQQERKHAVAKAVGVKYGRSFVRIKTPVGKVVFDKRSINHITSRKDPRYRFAHLIRPTLEKPNEVWSRVHSSGEVRLSYIKQFASVSNTVIVGRKGNRVITSIVTSKTRKIQKRRIGYLEHVRKERK